jgi:hypothetical protein
MSTNKHNFVVVAAVVAAAEALVSINKHDVDWVGTVTYIRNQSTLYRKDLCHHAGLFEFAAHDTRRL